MKQKKIEKGMIRERKYLLPLNKIVSDKRTLALMCSVMTIFFILLFNYLWNCVVQFPDFAKDLSNPALYFSIKNMFLFDFKNHYVFYFLLVLILCGINGRFIYLVNVNIKDMNVGQKDSARWTTIKEIQEQYPSMDLQGEHLAKTGGIPICQYKGRVYFDDTAVNNMIIGMTRSGKGEQFLLLMIWIYCNAAQKSSLIINDPKMEHVTAATSTLEKNGFDVWVLNLVNPLQGIGFDPLEEMKKAWKAKKYSDAELMARSLAEQIYHPSHIQGEAKFWASTSASLFAALIIAQVTDCMSADEKINAKNILEWKKKQKAFSKLKDEEKKAQARAKYLEAQNKLTLRYIPTDCEYVPTYVNEKKINLYSVCRMFMELTSNKVDDKGKTALDVYFEERPNEDRAKLKFFSTQIAPELTKTSIYASMIDELTIFTYEEIAKMTSHSTVDLAKIGFGEKPVAVFLCTPDWDTSNHFLASTFISQVYFVLSKIAATRPKKKFDRDVVLILDEVGMFPTVTNIQNMVSLGTGKGFYMTFVLQAYSQLDHYKEIAKTIKQNCGNHIYILSEDEDTRKQFSEAVNKETVTNVHRTGKYLSLEKTIMEVYEERPLITINELSNLAEGENVIVRYIKRRDNDNEKIRANPIFNTGETAFKYRHEYMLKQFPNDIPFEALKLNHKCKEDFDLKDICIDIQAIFTEKLKRMEAEQVGEKYYAENETPETVRLIKDLKRGDAITRQLQTFVHGRNCENLSVTEAITELERAENLNLITKAEKESILDLLISSGR